MLASTVEREFRALVDLLSRNISGNDVQGLVAIRAKAEKGLQLAIELVRELDLNEDEPFA